MARRLPIYFLLDCSESMAGKEIDDLQKALTSVTTSLRKDPYALETAWISVIAFAGRVSTIQPLKELVAFIPPGLPVGGGTALGEALNHLMGQMSSDVVKATTDGKGDWRPIVYLITDGRSTDNASAAIQRWNKEFRSKATMVAVSVGGQADHALLRQLTDDVIVFRDGEPEAFAKFAKWVTQSIGASSKSLEQTGVEIAPLAPLDDDVIVPLEKIERSGGGQETRGGAERYAVLVAKCSQNRSPYLLKYEQIGSSGNYRLANAIALTEDYFGWSAQGESAQSVNTSALTDAAPCPQCQSPAGLTICECSKVTCSGRGGRITCPWCGTTGDVGPLDRNVGLGRALG